MSEEKKIEGSDKEQGTSDKSANSDPIAIGSKKEKNEQPETKPATSNQQPFAEASADKPATEIMEVHKLPHHPTHKKKWGEYFLEFLMLFLAVFLGFLAENQREHMVERKHERQYVLSLLNDLKLDIAWLDTVTFSAKARINNLDSAMAVLS